MTHKSTERIPVTGKGFVWSMFQNSRMLSHDSIEFHFFFIQGCLKESSWRQIPKNRKIINWNGELLRCFLKNSFVLLRFSGGKHQRDCCFFWTKESLGNWKHKFQHHFLTQQNINSMENLGKFLGASGPTYLPPHGSLMFASSNHVVDFWEFHTRRPLQITDVSQVSVGKETQRTRYELSMCHTSLKTNMAGWKIPFFSIGNTSTHSWWVFHRQC